MSLSDTSAHHLNTCGDWASTTYFPGKPMPVFNHPFHEEFFPNSQSQPPLAQPEAVYSHPITCCMPHQNLLPGSCVEVLDPAGVAACDALFPEMHKALLQAQQWGQLLEGLKHRGWAQPSCATCPSSQKCCVSMF